MTDAKKRALRTFVQIAASFATVQGLGFIARQLGFTDVDPSDLAFLSLALAPLVTYLQCILEDDSKIPTMLYKKSDEFNEFIGD